MRRSGLGKARKTVTIALFAAFVCTFVYSITSFVVNQRPAFALTSASDPHFAITSTVDSTYPACTPSTAPAKLYPGAARCLAVAVHNPLSVPLTVTTLTMSVSSLASASSGTCPTTTLMLPALFSSSFSVPGKIGTTTGSVLIDKPIALLSTNSTQDSCETATFTFSFSATGRYTDTTTTTLAAALTGMTSAVLTATVTPTNPSSDPYGPARTTAPVHHVTFYSCATPSCASKTELSTGTVALTQTTGTWKSATASYHVSGLKLGTYYYEASYPATGTDHATFDGGTSHVESVKVTTDPPTLCEGKKFAHDIALPFFPVVYGTNQGDLIEVGSPDFWVDGPQGTDCVGAGTDNNVLFDGTGADAVQGRNGNNLVYLGTETTTSHLGMERTLSRWGTGMTR